jgi:hypothetical protein
MIIATWFGDLLGVFAADLSLAKRAAFQTIFTDT